MVGRLRPVKLRPGTQTGSARHADAPFVQPSDFPQVLVNVLDRARAFALAPGQEAAWNAFVEATRPAPRVGAGREAMRDELAKLDTPQRLDRMLAMSEARRVRLVERAEATKAFYAQLSPDQQRVFDAEAVRGRHHGHRHAHRHAP